MIGTTVLTASLVVSSCANGPEAADFEDPLIGPVSPAFVIPFESYALTPAGLARSNSPSGTENGIDRPVIRTVSGNYRSRDFIFEVDVTIPPGHGDIAYVGFGEGRNNPALDNEPTNALLFRIHNLPRLDFYGIDIAAGDPESGQGFRGQFRQFNRIGEYKRGETMRFRITHQAGQVTLSMPSAPAVTVTFPDAQFGDLFDRRKAHLFLANSSQGTTFRNASLRRP